MGISNRCKRIQETILHFLGSNNQDQDFLEQLTNELINIDGFPLILNFYLKRAHIQKLYSTLHEIYRNRLQGIDVDILSQNHPNLKILLFPHHKDVDDVIFACISNDLEVLFPRIDFFIEHYRDGRVLEYLRQNKVKFDDDNLVNVDDFELRRQGIIFKDRLLYYHPFLRRFFSARFIDTTELLMQAQVNRAVTLRIAVDPIRMTDAKNYLEVVEADHWRGPHFLIEKLNDPNFNEKTLHKRMENEDKKVLDATYPINATVFDIKNQSKGSKKSISIEEILPTDGRVGITDNVVLHRFAHLEWDHNQQRFTHFDCSVFVYKRDAHRERFSDEWNPQLNRTKGKPQKIKLFRLDGSIEIDYAFQLLGAFFRYNEMISEFFGGYSTNNISSNLIQS